MGGACGGEGGACGKKTMGWTGDTGRGEHSAAVGEESLGDVMVWDDSEVARQMMGSDEGDNRGGLTGAHGAL